MLYKAYYICYNEIYARVGIFERAEYEVLLVCTQN